MNQAELDHIWFLFKKAGFVGISLQGIVADVLAELEGLRGVKEGAVIRIAGLERERDEARRQLSIFDDVANCRLNPGDTLVVMQDEQLSLGRIQELKGRLAEHFPGHKILVLPPGVTLGAVEDVVGEIESPPAASDRLFDDDAYCEHCDADTPHKIYETGHERDMSNDWRKCLKCGWRWSGMTGKYEPTGE